MSTFKTLARKRFNGKFRPTAKIADQAFYVAITDADIGGLKYLLYTLFVKYLDRMLGKIVWYEILTIYNVDANLEDVYTVTQMLIERLSSFVVPKIMVVRYV